MLFSFATGEILKPVFIFLVANAPFPLILALNLRITLRFLRVWRLSHGKRTARQSGFRLGWWIGNSALIFSLAPSIVERRIFVHDHKWLVFYGISTILSLTGLILMNRALDREVKGLQADLPPASVDTPPPDTL